MALTDPAPMTYRRKPAEATPEAIARAHMPLVRKIAWHVHGRVSTAIEVEDLIQIGMVALVEAANGYQDRGHAFSTYATMRIRGAMIDHLRRHATLCRSAMARRRELANIQKRLQGRLGRAPTEAEMAEEMGLAAAAYRELVDQSQAVHHDSLDDMYSDHSMWFADIEERADEALEREGLKAAIASGIRDLPEREAIVLQLYFVEEMNLEEIGLTLNIGAARVCQIKKAALNKLRHMLADWG
ncbi:FliA/WhiG family RNA polymerase sigma factor [Sphingosinicella sp. LY1275]|uniref:sigma-70 family RNA polymerase sigma factor n=1 Tax=Sphingosinicella sp. LY1275 TaxID=3095379 RepID=UPI002ADEE499|nr:FliA/WhiG family RNA polymerase sigma factor [Sphingosinicella sp. LY1275]MEA1015940.1 FliA/WhiG family RNA polymerase sigma factor [Sphingosinicella sp. LY1275]